MSKNTSQQRYARERQEQTNRRREEILDAAQSLFLKKGLENVSMKEIAETANISKMTLYRYFSSRDPIAFEIAVRMLNSIHIFFNSGNEGYYEADHMVKNLIAMTDKFHKYEHVYRYLGMFDHLYAQNYPSNELAQWYKTNILFFNKKTLGPDKIVLYTMLGNATMSFLQKLAARGKLLEEEQEVSINDQLESYKRVLKLLLTE